MNKITRKAAAALLKERDNILLLTHIRPDGDTLGSAWGLKCALEGMGKTVFVVNDDLIPRRLQFVLEGAESLSYELLPEGFVPGLVVSLDVAEMHLMGDFCRSLADQIELKIDHHAMGAPFGKFNLIDGSAAACAEIVLDLVEELGAMNDRAAAALYIGIASDTGCFRFSNVTADTHRRAAALIARGVDFPAIHSRLFESKSRTEIKAIQISYQALKFYRGGSVASIMFTAAMKEENGLAGEELGDISSLPREIEGVELSVVIKQSEKHPERFKISMRSGESVAANELCALFGGGGHIRAAGGMVEAASAEEAETRIMTAVLAAMDEKYGVYVEPEPENQEESHAESAQ